MADKKKSVPAKKKSGAEVDVFEAYEAKHKKAQSGASKKKGAVKKSAAKKGSSGRSKKKKKQRAWWPIPVTVVMVAILAFLGATAMREKRQYEDFIVMRETVDVAGFYPGVSIDGTDITGRGLSEVLGEIASREQAIRDSLHVTLVCGDRSWTITADELDYQSNYESVVRSAWQIGHEGSIAQRYQAIRELRQGGAHYTIERGYDQTLLRAITDMVAAEMTIPAQDAYVISFDMDSLTFNYGREQSGTYVDAEQLYLNTLSAIESGAAEQTVVVSQQTVQPRLTVDELTPLMGEMASARTKVEGDRDRRSNVALGLSLINGVRVEPGEVFSFNNTVGERTPEAGFKMAGAYMDGLPTQEYGGGICQVSTTLFNAIAKSDLELIARSPHSRPVTYVDKGKDATVSWPNQDLKFMNDTDYPVFIKTDYDESSRWCSVTIYGKKLDNGVYITIEAAVIKVYEPGDPVYKYTRDLPTGEKKKIDMEHEGYYCESYKIYHSADGTELSRELYCRSTYPASGGTYLVGQ